MEPLVSILIPAYNAETWIADAIESAAAQTWRRKEIIIVDDGSRDGTLAVARRYAKKTVNVVTQANQGVCVARNKAFSVSQGDYIQWLDADDVLAEDKIERQLARVDYSDRSDELLSSAWGRFYYRTHRAKFKPNPLWQDLRPKEWLLRKMELNLWMAIESWLVSRNLAERAGPWDVRLVRDNDGEYFSRVICASEGIRFVAGARSYCRLANLTSISNDFYLSGKKLESLFLSQCLSFRYLRSLEESERTRTACLASLQRCLGYFYPDRSDIIEMARDVAAELGGELSVKEAIGNRARMERILGRRLTERVRSTVPKTKAWLAMNWDKLLFSVSQ
jgi:glycosyltransferase involved in cell wall biosynthesis